MKNWTPRELYHAFCSGTPEETQEAYEYLLPKLMAVCLNVWSTLSSSTEQIERARDCVHQAIFNTWLHCSKIKSPDAFEGFIKRAVENSAKNAISDQMRHPQAPLDDLAAFRPDPSPAPEEQLLYQELLLELAFLLRIAPCGKRSRYIIAATFIEIINDREIAQQLLTVEGKPIGVPEIHSERSRNLSKLRSKSAISERLHTVLREIVNIQHH